MGIFIVAILVTALGSWWGAKFIRMWGGWNRCHAVGFAVALPFSPIVNLWMKKPLIELLLRKSHVGQRAQDWPWWIAALVLVTVGVCEEAIKVTPAVASSIRAAVRSRESAVPMAFSIGLGFALGEVWYLAAGLYLHDRATASLPFYLLGGFLSERLATIFIHSFLSLVALHGLLVGRGRFWLGVAGAMLLHALADLAPMLYQMKRLSPEPTALVIALITLGSFLPFYRYSKKKPPAERTALLATSARVLYTDDDQAEPK